MEISKTNQQYWISTHADCTKMKFASTYDAIVFLKSCADPHKTILVIYDGFKADLLRYDPEKGKIAALTFRQEVKLRGNHDEALNITFDEESQKTNTPLGMGIEWGFTRAPENIEVDLNG